MHCDSPAAYEAFTNDPDFLSIKHLRDECTDLLSVGGRLIRANPAPPDEQRVYGIEMVEFPNGSPAAYRRYELEGEQAMAKYGFQAEYVLHVETTSSVDRHFDMAKVSSFPSMAHRAAFESDPVHAHIERELYPAGVADVIWVDAVLHPAD